MDEVCCFQFVNLQTNKNQSFKEMRFRVIIKQFKIKAKANQYQFENVKKGNSRYIKGRCLYLYVTSLRFLFPLNELIASIE